MSVTLNIHNKVKSGGDMEISVIAPVYNEEENINRLIENVEKVLMGNFKS